VAEFIETDGWHGEVAKLKASLLDRVSTDILTDMKRGAPVDTGFLVSDLDREVQGDTARIGAKTADYAAAVEEGHRIVYRDETTGELVDTGKTVPAQPYMKPALYQRRNLA
jgi:hypothetical protein